MSRRAEDVRGGGDGEGAGLCRASSYRATRCARGLRGPLEALEPRTLLSASPPVWMLPSVPMPMSPGPMIQLERMGGGGQPGTVSIPEGVRPDVHVVPMMAQVSTPTVRPLTVMGMGGGGGSVPMEGSIQLMSTSSGSLGEDGMTPVVVVVTGTRGIPVVAGPEGQGWSGSSGNPSTTSGDAAWSGMPAGLENSDASPPAADGTGTVATSLVPGPVADPSGNIPDVKHAEVVGSIDTATSTSSLTVRIPVGPMTRELGLTLHGGGNPADGSMTAPSVTDLSLLDSSGHMIEHLGQPWEGQDPGGSEALTLALKDVPNGTLMVQIATPPGASGASFPPLVGSSLPFVMDVQRIDVTASSSSTTVNLSGSTAGLNSSTLIGTTAGFGSGASQTWSWGGLSPNSEDSESLSAMVVDPSGQSVWEDAPEFDDSAPMNESARIAVGPLAARVAAPMGPSLSDVPVDLAPPIDRHERALSQEIVARSSDGIRDPARPRRSTEGSETSPGRIDGGAPAAGSFLAMAGLGQRSGRHSSSTGVDRDLDDDLSALHAALFADAWTGNDPEESHFQEANLAGGALLAALMPPDHERPPVPDYLTSACILAFGMGLVGGPMFPDLLRLIPKRSSRWRGFRNGLRSVDEPSAGNAPRFVGWRRRQPGG